jgi:hypothetical protein
MHYAIAFMPKRIWVEMHDEDDSACDVIVEMEDGGYYSALFVTLSYLRRQMALSYDVGLHMQYTPAVRYAAMETPQILVDSLDHDTIEDAIDNLIALDTFETFFARVIEEEDDRDGRIRTAEVAAVVLNEVLRAEETTVA